MTAPTANRLPQACPICREIRCETICTLDCGNIDNSTLYATVRLKSCLHCGHAFNELSEEEIAGLTHYYNAEYAPANLNVIDTQGDRPGSTAMFTAERYSQLLDILMPYLQKESEILDVGCAMGGFLEFLDAKGFSRLSGVDMTDLYVKQASAKNRFSVKQGHAESLPFKDNLFDVVVMEQVLEHLVDPAKAFHEARRVLKDGGMLCIGVPDASRYSDYYFFDFYWLLLREHIQHFDVISLSRLAQQAGYEMLTSRQTTHTVMSDKMIMPNIYSIFRKCDAVRDGTIPNARRPLAQQLKDYVAMEHGRSMVHAARIARLSESRRPVYVWGIGREFLYLYESAGLKNCNIAGLIDMNPVKQMAAVDGIQIVNSDLLRNGSRDSVLLITAIAHAELITRNLKTEGFAGEIFDFAAAGSLFLQSPSGRQEK